MRRRVAGWPKFGLLPKEKGVYIFIRNVSRLKTPSKARMYCRSSMRHSLGLDVVALYFEGNTEDAFPVVNGSFKKWLMVPSLTLGIFCFCFSTFTFLIDPRRRYACGHFFLPFSVTIIHSGKDQAL